MNLTRLEELSCLDRAVRGLIQYYRAGQPDRVTILPDGLTQSIVQFDGSIHIVTTDERPDGNIECFNIVVTCRSI